MADDISMAEMLKGSVEAGRAWRDVQKKQDLDRIFSQNIDERGNLDEAQFYRSAHDLGLGPSEIQTALDYHTYKKAAEQTVGSVDTGSRMMAYDPRAGGRNNAGFGAPVPPLSEGAGTSDGRATWDNTPVPGNVDVDKLGQGGGVPVTSTSVSRGASSERPDVSSPAPETAEAPKNARTELEARRAAARGTSENTVDVQAEGQAPWKSYALDTQQFYPGMDSGIETTKAPKDNRSSIQMFEDSYDPSKSPLAQLTGGGVGKPAAPQTWNAKNVGNEFQQYSSTLKNYLASQGETDAGAYLDKVRAAAYAENAPKPVNPYAMFGADGKIDRRAYGEAVALYNQQEIQAQGKADMAVMAEKRKLMELAGKTGEQAHSSEQFDADMAGRRPGEVAGSGGIVRDRRLSAEEKTQGDIMAQAWQDVKANAAIGDKYDDPSDQFASNYAVATAVARANGNVNGDVIASNLASMGAIPSTAYAVLSQALRANPGSPAKDIYMLLKNEFADQVIAGSAAKRRAWIDNALTNIEQGMKLKGYSVRPSGGKGEAKGASTSSAPANARTELEAKQKKAKASKAAKAKASVAPKLPGTPVPPALNKSGNPIMVF